MIEKIKKHTKVTWKHIYDDFKRVYPTLSKDAVKYEPYCYATIKVWISNVGTMLYDYDSKHAKFIS